MHRYADVTRQTLITSSQLQPVRFWPWLPFSAAIVGLALLTLACALIAPPPAANRVHIRHHLPTLTPTPLALAATPAAAPAVAPPAPTAALTPATASEVADPAAQEVTLPAEIAAADTPAIPVEVLAANLAVTPTNPPPNTPTETPLPTDTPVPTATDTPFPTDTATATATPTPTPQPWSFVGVRLQPIQDEDGLLLFGTMVNNTGTAQALKGITAAFYDGQGQVIANSDNAYWSADVVPPGGSNPFEIIVDTIDSAADYQLSVEAEPSDQTPRQDFQFEEVQQFTDEGGYCVAGQVRNPGGGLQNYLVVAVVLYDGQDRVVNFNDYITPGPGEIMGDQTLPFEICIDPPNQDVARHELRAWGL